MFYLKMSLFMFFVLNYSTQASFEDYPPTLETCSIEKDGYEISVEHIDKPFSMHHDFGSTPVKLTFKFKDSSTQKIVKQVYENAFMTDNKGSMYRIFSPGSQDKKSGPIYIEFDNVDLATYGLSKNSFYTNSKRKVVYHHEHKKCGFQHYTDILKN